MSDEGSTQEDSDPTDPPAELIELLGKVSDLQLHYQFGWSYPKISKLRKSLGIPAFQAQKPETHPIGDDAGAEWWSISDAARAWGVTYARARKLMATIPGLVRHRSNRIQVRKGTPKPMDDGQ